MKMLVNTEPHGVGARKIRRFEGDPIDDRADILIKDGVALQPSGRCDL
jgi:hypothetical protein